MNVFAKVRVEVPNRIVRATVPLPPGAFAWNKDATPIALRAPDGRVLLTQWERVIMERDKRHVELAEVLAIDDAPSFGGPVTYEVLEQQPRRDRPAQPGSWAEAFLDRQPELVMDGSTLPCDVYAPGQARSGAVANTDRFAGPGYAGFATTFAGSDVVLLDFYIHDALAQSRPKFFNELALRYDGSVCFTAWPEPLLSDVRGSHVLLAGKRADGNAWILPQRYVRRWRIALAGPGSEVQARAILDDAGWGVCDQWSQRGCWRPHLMRFPDGAKLPAQLVSLMRAASSIEWTEIRDALANGTTYGTNVKPGQPGGRVGLFSPWGVDYGGSTGGADRELVAQQAIYMVVAGSEFALRAMRAEASMVAYRTPTFLMEENGVPCKHEDWIDGAGNPLGGWEINGVDGNFAGAERQRDGAFGFYANRTPPAGVKFDQSEWDKLTQYNPDSTHDDDGFKPTDDQHLVRYWKAAAGVALLGDGDFEKMMLRSRSEVWRMGQLTGGNCKGELAQIKSFPQHGTVWGRGHGHPLAMSSIAYDIGNDNWRHRWDAFLTEFANGILDAQMPNGFLRAAPAYIKNGSMFFDAQGRPIYAVTTPDEEVYVALGAHGVVCPDGATDHAWISELARAIWEHAWRSGSEGAAPCDYLAVRALARSATPFVRDLDPRNGHDDAEVAHVFALAIAAGYSHEPHVEAYVAKRGGLQGVLSRYTSAYKLSLGIDDDIFLIRELMP